MKLSAAINSTMPSTVAEVPPEKTSSGLSPPEAAIPASLISTSVSMSVLMAFLAACLLGLL